MSIFIKQAFVAFLSYAVKRIAIKCISLINKPCVPRPTLVDQIQLKFIIIHLWLV